MRFDRMIVLIILAVLIIISGMLVRPYVQFILAAVLLAFVLHPVQVRIAPYVGKTPAAVLLVFVAIIAILLPLVVIGVVIAEDAMTWIGHLQDADVDLSQVETLIADYTGQEVDLATQIQDSLEGAVSGLFGGALAAFGMITHMLIGLGLLVFLLFFFLRDGRQFSAWTRDVSPMSMEVTDEFMERSNAIIKAVLAGHVLIAIVQGVIAGLGLLVTGVPNVAFWTFVMVLLALIPLIGTFFVWAPASVYLYVTGSPVAAVGLFIYGVLVVSISDEYLRPIVVDRFANISPGIIILGVLGGITVFGFVGLFIGPIVVGMVKETIEIHDRHFGTV